MLSRLSKFISCICSVLLFSFFTMYPSQPVQELAAGSLARLASDGKDEELEAAIGERNIDINKHDEIGRTPLQEAICEKHATTVGLLCRKKQHIDINKYSLQGFTALHYAVLKSECESKENCTCDYCKIVTSLLDDKSLIIDKAKQSCSRIRTYLPFGQLPSDEGITALHIAASKGDIQNVNRLITRGANVNQLTCIGRSPLHYAACQHKKKDSAIEVINKLFLSRTSININQEDSSGFTPLHMAINSQPDNNIDIVQCLVEHGADINNKSCDLTPLMAAVNREKISIVRFLLEKGAKVDEINAYGRTALDLAIENKSEDIQRCLITYKATCRLSKKYLEGMKPQQKWILYPLHEAADAGNLEQIKQLMDPESPFQGLFSDTDSDSCTALHYAARRGRTEVFAYLLGKNIDVNAVDKDQKTPLYYATENGHDEIVKRILEQEPATYLSKPVGENSTIGAQLLTIAADKKHKEVALELVEHGAGIDNLFIWAVANDFEGIVHHLLGPGKPAIQFNHQDSDGKTALDRALETKNMEMVALLIKAGALANCAPMEMARLRELASRNGLIEHFDNLVDTRKIVAQHSEFTLADKQEEGISLNCPELKGLELQGFIRPSLQQNRNGCASDKYSCYYALFNATRISGQNYLDRELFAHFFEKALTFIKSTGTPAPYDNLTSEQLLVLLQEIKRDPRRFGIETSSALEEIVIMRLNNLDNFLSGKKDAAEAFNDKCLPVIYKFINGTINTITLIAANRTSPAWFTLIATRDSQGQVSLEIFDSSLTLKKSLEAPLYNICRLDIILFYLMLTRPIHTLKNYITDILEMEINKVCSAYSRRPAANKVETFIDELDKFIECISSLRESVKNQAKTDSASGSLQDMKIIHALRLGLLSREYYLFFNKLFDDLLKRKMQDPIVATILTFLKKYSLIVDELKGKLDFLINNTATSNGEKNLTKCEIIESLKGITDDAIALKANIAQNPDSLLKSGKFFDAQPEKISENKLDIIKRFLQPEVRKFIREQSNGTLSGMKTLLFYGEPGNGKTTIAQAIAKLCPYKDTDGTMKDRPFRIMRVPALGTKFQFSKQEQLNSLTTYIKENPYAVILLDEIDALADSKHDLDSSVQDFDQILDSAKDTNVIIIGTTNSDINAKFTTDTPDHSNKPMAPALKSRLQNHIKIENPTLEHRRAIIKNCLAMLTVKDPHTKVCLTSQDEEALAKRTAGFSIRDMETVFILAHQYVFTSSDSSDEDVSRIKYRQLTNKHTEEAFQAIKKGKRINYMHIAMNCLKNVAIHGPAWLNFAYALYSGYIHGLERNADIKRLDSDRLQHQSELHDDLIRRKEDRIHHLSELSDDLIRNSLIRDSSQAIHEAEIATDRYIQAVRRDEDSRWQVIHTGVSVAGLVL